MLVATTIIRYSFNTLVYYSFIVLQKDRWYRCIYICVVVDIDNNLYNTVTAFPVKMVKKKKIDCVLQ